jgi:hypothetical protein
MAPADPLTGINEEFFATVLKRWRGMTATAQANPDGAYDARELESTTAAPLAPAPAPEPPRPSLLKRPLADRLDISRAFAAPARPCRLPEA